MSTLVPELLVRDIAVSRAFYVDVLGFEVIYERPATRFVYLSRDGADLMIEQIDDTAWITGPLDLPYGRGVNFEIGVKDVAALARRVAATGHPLFRLLEDAWYRVGDAFAGNRQVLVQDPDGYLLRFAQSLGHRRTPPDGARVRE